MKNSRTTCAAIHIASSEAQVIQAVRDYLASLSPDEVALMPSGLTALGTSHADEVVHSALQLVQQEIRAALDAPEAELLRDAVLVFSTAATRLAALAAFRMLPHRAEPQQQ